MDNLRKYGQPPYGLAVIHGGPGAPGEMAPVARELSKTCGVLEPLQSRDTLTGQLEELVTTLRDHASLPVVLIGHSWGAMLSFILAAHHPALVRKLILVSSAVFEEKYAAGIMETRLSRLSEEDRLAVSRLLSELDDPAGNDEKRTFAQLELRSCGSEPRDRQTDIPHPAPVSAPDLSEKDWASAQTSERLDVGDPQRHELDITHITPGSDLHLSKNNTAYTQFSERADGADHRGHDLDISHPKPLSELDLSSKNRASAQSSERPHGAEPAGHDLDTTHATPGSDPRLSKKNTAFAQLAELMAWVDTYDPLVDISTCPADSCGLSSGVDSLDIRRQICECRARQSHINEDIIEFQHHIYEAVWRDACKIRSSGDLLRLGRDIKCPVVAIHGDWDPHPPEGVRIPLSNVVDDFRFILLDCCGHYPWYERQAREKFYALIRKELQI